MRPFFILIVTAFCALSPLTAAAAPTPILSPGDRAAASNRLNMPVSSIAARVTQLRNDWQKLKAQAQKQSSQLETLRIRSEDLATDYYASVALMNAKLQRGTTPGNPAMVEMLNKAQSRLEQMAGDVQELNMLSNEVMNSASMASYLLESVRSTYTLSGAYERDHEALREVEDDVNQTVIKINRQLTSLSDDLDRRASTLATERRNLQTLALAVSNGQLYGKSIANRAFATTATQSGFAQAGYAAAPMQTSNQQLLPPFTI